MRFFRAGVIGHARPVQAPVQTLAVENETGMSIARPGFDIEAMGRALAITKHRGSAHGDEIRPYRITEKGLVFD